MAERLEPRVLLSSELVKDIAAVTVGSSPNGFTSSGDWLYFSANDTVHGQELWKTDGTDRGTSLVADLTPGPGHSNPGGLTDVNGRLFFVADNRLWVTDGTAAGTWGLATLNITRASMTAVGNRLFFSAQDSEHGSELWTSDGTPAGTHLVKDIKPGASSSGPADLISYGGLLAFRADDGVHGQELWRSDGTELGTFIVKDINPGAIGSMPLYPVIFGDSLYFSASDGVHGAELWTSDLSTSETYLVKDINPGAEGSSPSQLSVIGNTLYLQAFEPLHGSELWKSDGTAAGTAMVKDLTPGPGTSLISRVSHIGNMNLFVAADSSTMVCHTWTTNGTPGGTVQVSLNGKPFSGGQVVAGGYLYYTITVDSFTVDLWRTDGTAAGTQQVATGLSQPYLGTLSMAEYKGSLYIGAPTPGHWLELCRVDDDSPAPKLVSVVNQTTFDGEPRFPVRSGNSVYFLANDGLNAYQLWKSDGSEAGTSLVKTIGVGWGPGGYDEPRSFVAADADGTLFFKYRTQLWKSDGTADGTVMIKDVAINNEALIYSMTAVGKTVYFANWAELWKSDGTPEGTGLVKDLGPGYAYPDALTNVNGTLYFAAIDGVHGFELWKSDGTEAGTGLVKDIAPEASDSSPQNLVDFNGTLYFTATTPESGRQIWKSDGTAEGTVQVTHLAQGLALGQYFEMLPVGGILYFVNNDGELWKTDGSDAGTVRVKEIFPGLQGSGVQGLTNVNGTLFFLASDPAYGLELYKSDGTEAGTVRLSTTLSAQDEYQRLGPMHLTPVGNMLYFTATDGVRPRELWRSDGTIAGTAIEEDLLPGWRADNPTSLVALGNSLLYVGKDPVHGSELRRVDAVPKLTADAGEGYRLYEDQSITLSAAGSFSPDSSIVSYEWDFNYGYEGVFTPDATGPTAVLSGVDSPGLFVAIRVTDALGRSHIDVARVTVLNRPPTVSMSGSADPVKEGEFYTIALYAGDDPGPDTISSWRIDWGDGKTDYIQGNPSSASHAYGKPGHFAITAAAFDEDGGYGTNSIAIASVDDKFGREGKVVHPAPSNRRLVVLDDGKIVTAGGDENFVLTRYFADGNVDPTFGKEGDVVTDITGGPESAQALVPLEDGRLLVGGTARGSGGSDWVLARYLPDGRLDEAFGQKGMLVLHRVDGAADELCSLVVSGDSIYAAGSIDERAAAGGINFAVAKLDAAGHLDTTFGTRGYATAAFGTAARAAAMKKLDDGRILLAGTANPDSPASQIALAQFLPDGSPDPGFGTKGQSLIDLPTVTGESISALDIQDTGKLVLVGSVTGTLNDYPYSYLVVRVDPDGSLDKTFGKNGSVVSGWSDSFAAVAVLSNGNIIAGGTGIGRYLYTVRFTRDGVVDSTFSSTVVSDGFVAPDFYLGNERAADMVIQPDGKIVMLGAVNGQSLLARYGQAVPTAWAEVVNVAPKADLGADRTAKEGAPLTIQGTFTDPGYAETFTYRWHVTSSNGQVIPDATTPNLTFTPKDDGIYTVQFTVADSAGISDTDTLLVTAINVAPSVNAGADKTAREGDTFTITPTVTDPGPDTFTFLWHITSNNGQIIPDSTTKVLTFRPPDDGIYTAVLTVTDDDGGTGSDTVIFTVSNVAPTLGVSFPAGAFAGISTQVRLYSSDPGADAIKSWSFDWGDGTTETVDVSPTPIAHVYAAAGSYTIRASATDEDGTYKASPATLAVMPQPTLTAGVLTIPGTTAADTVDVLLTVSSCRVTVNGATTTFPPIDKLVLASGAGNDKVTLSGPIPAATVDLGEGSNMLNIGSAVGELLTLQPGGGTDSLNLSSGQLTLVGSVMPPSGPGGPSVSVARNSTLNLSGSHRFRSLSINSNGRVNVLPGGDKVLMAGSIGLSNGASLDMSDNDLILTGTATTRTTLLAQMAGWIKAARGSSGDWSGAGVTSSSAKANKQTGLAVLLNEKNGKPILSTFAGQSVNENDIVVKYTWNGDVNLDGVVDGDDYFSVDSGFISRAEGYCNGDLNFDGVVDGDDYFLIDSAFIAQTDVQAAVDTAVKAEDLMVKTQTGKPQAAPSVLKQLFSTKPVV
ncbi:MAG: ELWxxDGT repeat protein [Bacillota bacterium]